MYKSIMFVRFSLSDRISHWIFALVVFLLAVTGFTQMFPMDSVSLWIFNSFGGIEDIRALHHGCGFISFVFILYLIGAMAYQAFIRKIPITMVPTSEDLQDILQAYRYNLNATDARPSLGRATLTKKFIFWALMWGSIIMLLTGFILLNPIVVTSLLPGVVIPMAKIAHGFEALLVILVLIIWHAYFFLMKRLDAMITIAHPELKEGHRIDHPIDAVDLYDNRDLRKINEDTIETYWRYHLPAYLLACGALLLGAFYFINFETTSILTYASPENVPVFAPDEHIHPTGSLSGRLQLTTELPHESGAINSIHSWKSGIGILLLTNCANCHESEGISGVNLRDYQSVVDYDLVIPGLPDESRILTVISDERHADRYSVRLYDTIYDWISSGAPEVNIPPELEERYSSLTWNTDIRQIMSDQCIECHGSRAFHDLDFRSYYSTLDSGAIVLSSPDESPIFIKIGAGGHPGQFSADELLDLHEWIRNGAQSGMSADEAALEYREIQLAGFPIAGDVEATDMEEPESTETEELPGVLLTWDDNISAIFTSACTMCHGSNALGGVDLSSYEVALDSGSIIPGDPESSSLIITMRSESHPALLSAEDLDAVIQWISGGAPKSTESTAGDIDILQAPEPVEPEDTPGMRELWDEGIGSIFSASCTTCHGSNAIGGVDLTSYDAVMESGSIVPGDPAGSSLIVLMESGNHPALLSEEDLAAIRDWIIVGE